jgi:hypothetical protein
MKRLFILLILVVLVGCATLGKGHSQGEGLTDPFTYCASVGNADVPGLPYKGPRVPPILVKMVRKAFGISPMATDKWVKEEVRWRCMNGRVWVCFGGANIPCMVKANTSDRPTPQMVAFCKTHPHALKIPVNVRGRATVYEWRCEDGKPQIVKEIYTPDSRGFISQFWRPLPPP